MSGSVLPDSGGDDATGDPLVGDGRRTDSSGSTSDQGDSSAQSIYYDASTSTFVTLDGDGDFTPIDPSEISDFSQVQSLPPDPPDAVPPGPA